VVREGQPVLAFDSSDLQRQLQTYQAEAEGARTEIEKKKAEIELLDAQSALLLAEADARLRKAALKVDVPGELTSENELREAKLDLELARKEIAYVDKKIRDGEQAGQAAIKALEDRRERAENKVSDMLSAIESMTVKAPRDGTVIYVTNWREEKKKVGDSCWRGEKVVEIPNLDRMMADGEVDEADASRVAAGQKLSLRLDAHPDEEFGGTVSNIWGTVQRKSWRNPVKVVRLDIGLDRTDVRRMRPGMRFRGTIEIERVQEALVIPIEAVFSGDGGPTVYRKTFMGYDRVPVRLGRRNDNDVEVLEGLRDGDRVSRTEPGGSEQDRT
jgi:RND family efflux transporter MFP subunit